MKIDIDKLRKDMREQSLGAAFMGGFGGAFMEAGDIDHASPERLVQLAQKQGIDLRRYETD